MPSPGDLPIPGSRLRSPALQVASLPAELPGKATQRLAFFNGLENLRLKFFQFDPLLLNVEIWSISL